MVEFSAAMDSNDVLIDSENDVLMINLINRCGFGEGQLVSVHSH